jgi:imidazolonepropionase-like amidohydrolase
MRRSSCATERSSASGRCDVPAGIDVVDATGMFATPGLFDAHVHFSQTGWADARPDALDLRTLHPYEKTVADLRAHPERFGRSHLCSGITGVFDVGGYTWTTELDKRFARDSAAPHVATAGPLLTTRDHWLNLPGERQFLFLTDEASARNGVRYLSTHGADAIKVWYINDNPAGIEAAGAAAREAKLPLIVHATELSRAKAAMRAGAKLLVHSVEDAPIDEEFVSLARQHGTIVTPTLTVMRGYARMFEAVLAQSAPAIDDPNRCVDAATRARVESSAKVDRTLVEEAPVRRWIGTMAKTEGIAAANLKKLVDAGIPVATGTDAGNPLTLHGPSIYAEMEAMQNAGMTAMQVLVSSTATAARAAGLDAVTGTLEKGKSADLLLLAADPTKDARAFRTVKQVMRGGVIRGVEELSAMAQ